MKKLFFIVFAFFTCTLCAEEKVQIELPKITTYVESVVEQKIVITEDDIEKMVHNCFNNKDLLSGVILND